MHPHPLAITVSFLCMLKFPFLHRFEIGSKCGITRWGLRWQGASLFIFYFFARGRGCRRHYQGVEGIQSWGGRAQNHFSDRKLFFIFNLKILLIWFCWVSRCHLKALFTNSSKQILLFEICRLQNWVRSCQHIGGTPCIWMLFPLILCHWSQFWHQK